MTSFRQIEANRRNARKSTGPTTEQGKQRSRRNAVRHGLTAETVIGALEDEKTTERSKRRSLPTTMPNQPSNANWCCGWPVYCGDSAALPPWKRVYLRSKQTISIGLDPTTSFNRLLGNWSMLCSTRARQLVMTRCPRARNSSPNGPSTLRVASYAYPISPITRSIASVAMKQPCGARLLRPCLHSMP
jgi:hypothetical protein